jgi:hypothetical protein
MVSLLMVSTPEEAVLLIPVKLPEEVRLNWLKFLIVFPFNSISEFTVLPTDIPSKEVVVALEVDNTRMLLDVVLLPIILLLTGDGAIAPFIYKPVKAAAAGADPILFISIPPIWLPLIRPLVLAQLIPVITDVLAVAVVEVVITMDPLLALDPIVLPSPAEAPPIVIPEPFVSMPVKTVELAAVGTEETLILAIVLPFINEAGDVPLVVNTIPW